MIMWVTILTTRPQEDYQRSNIRRSPIQNILRPIVG
jgi:hypothetical protein